MNDWYRIKNEFDVDSPALLIYPDRVQRNINLAIAMVADVSCLRPHVKTNKMREVTEMLLTAGIKKFKCATIAEAEMLALAGAKDILLAYQPNPVKANRLLALQQNYPEIYLTCLVDNLVSAKILDNIFAGKELAVYLDLNVGMNRTGVKPEKAVALYKSCQNFKNIKIIGIHAYDGHLHHPDLNLRTELADAVYKVTKNIKVQIEAISGEIIKLVMGGTPTFPFHATRPEVETSPGTFVFSDEGYRSKLKDLPFKIAAVLLVRVISIIDENNLCLDLGHKAVAAENPFPRVKFLNVTEAEPILQSEEHLVVRVNPAANHQVGDVWYGVPYHICPTVALYDSVRVVKNQQYVKDWRVIARDRTLTI